MGYYKTPKGYQDKFGRAFVDAYDVPVVPGDTIVILKERNSIQINETAIVRGYHNTEPGYAACEFANHDDLGDCDGLIGGHRGHWIPHLELSKFVALPLDEAVDEEVKQIVSKLNNQTSLSIIGGKVYDLQPVENVALTSSLNKITEACAKQLKETILAANAATRLVKQELQNAFVFPQFTLNHVRRGMTIYRDGNYLVYVLPFHFAPKFFARDYKTPTHQLSEEHQKKLDTNVFFQITVNRQNQITNTALFKERECQRVFAHYHGNGSDCLGTVKDRNINNPNEALAFRDKYQNVLAGINVGHQVRDECKGLYIDALHKDATPVVEGDTWTTKTLPKTPPKEPKVGDRVRLVGLVDQLQDSDLGIEGTIIAVRLSHRYAYGVEFDNKLHCGHSCDNRGKDGYCYNIPYESLELIEPTPPATTNMAADLTMILTTIRGEPTPPANAWTTTAKAVEETATTEVDPDDDPDEEDED